MGATVTPTEVEGSIKLVPSAAEGTDFSTSLRFAWNDNPAINVLHTTSESAGGKSNGYPRQTNAWFNLGWQPQAQYPPSWAQALGWLHRFWSLAIPKSFPGYGTLSGSADKFLISLIFEQAEA